MTASTSTEREREREIKLLSKTMKNPLYKFWDTDVSSFHSHPQETIQQGFRTSENKASSLTSFVICCGKDLPHSAEFLVPTINIVSMPSPTSTVIISNLPHHTHNARVKVQVSLQNPAGIIVIHVSLPRLKGRKIYQEILKRKLQLFSGQQPFMWRTRRGGKNEDKRCVGTLHFYYYFILNE